ncbi:MAG: cellulase family glycosylhydrolase [Elusimicrobiales bacterium]
MRTAALIALALIFQQPAVAENSCSLPVPTARHLPRWRGFNLTDKLHILMWRGPYSEEDFRLISKLGFNFVRLPIDYRVFLKDGDPEKFDEAQLKEIDQAIEWGRKYCIHVCLNLHRAPGYTVAEPPEPASLWTDTQAQRLCALQWVMFAKRYKGIPSNRLSFNLLNEPAGVKPGPYIKVASLLEAAIHKEDPDRLIISDGLQYGTIPVPELASLPNVAQSTRGYYPHNLTQYTTKWKHIFTPSWPLCDKPSGRLAPARPGIVNGPFEAVTGLRLHVLNGSPGAELEISADGKTLWSGTFAAGSFGRDCRASIPAGAGHVRLRAVSGWLEISEMGFSRAGAAEDVIEMDLNPARKPRPFGYKPGRHPPFTGLKNDGRNRLWVKCVAPWVEAQRQGVGVMVGEWGVISKTPHDVVLRWAEDSLANWQDAGWGWALWQFRGDFGILDSNRSDVHYEDFEGHKLDRQFLNLLQKY